MKADVPEENVNEGGPAQAAGWARWESAPVRWAVIFAVWTAVAFVFTCQYYFTTQLSEHPVTFRESASQHFIYPYLWALVTPFVLWAAARFPVDQRRWRRSLCVHLAFATVCAVVVMGAFQLIGYYFLVRPQGKPFSILSTFRTIIYNASESYGVYGLLLLLHHSVNYYRRFREGELRASHLQTRLAEAQLQALKMQLHPHFLFNTLHSISALVHKDPEAADRMIARLGDFLRLTLENSGAQEVTLEKELAFLKCYLEIERIRFHDRLTTRVDVDPRALDSLVPNLILQPIVENAIRHGIAPRATPGHIEILARHAGNSLRIQVKDNGPGLPPNPNGAAAEGLREGLGLANTRARLSQLYGTSHRFELRNDARGGLVVTLELPGVAAAPAA